METRKGEVMYWGVYPYMKWTGMAQVLEQPCIEYQVLACRVAGLPGAAPLRCTHTGTGGCHAIAMHCIAVYPKYTEGTLLTQGPNN